MDREERLMELRLLIDEDRDGPCPAFPCPVGFIVKLGEVRVSVIEVP